MMPKVPDDDEPVAPTYGSPSHACTVDVLVLLLLLLQEWPFTRFRLSSENLITRGAVVVVIVDGGFLLAHSPPQR
jgi:hypothetical protein